MPSRERSALPERPDRCDELSRLQPMQSLRMLGTGMHSAARRQHSAAYSLGAPRLRLAVAPSTGPPPPKGQWAAEGRGVAADCKGRPRAEPATGDRERTERQRTVASSPLHVRDGSRLLRREAHRMADAGEHTAPYEFFSHAFCSWPKLP